MAPNKPTNTPANNPAAPATAGTPPAAPHAAPQAVPHTFANPDLGPTTKEEILDYVAGKIKAPPHLPQIEGDTVANKADRVLVVHCDYRELYFKDGEKEVITLAKEKLKALFKLATEGVIQAARDRTADIQEKAPQAFALEDTAKLKEEARIIIIPTGMFEIVKPGDTAKILDNGRIYKIKGEDCVKCEITGQTEPKNQLTGFVKASAFDKAPIAKPLTAEETPQPSPEAPSLTPTVKLNIPDNPKIKNFNFNPDIIIACGSDQKETNKKRAHAAIQVLISKNPNATLIATGTSQKFRDANNGSSEAMGMYKAWEEAGYPKTELEKKRQSGQIVLEEASTSSEQNIVNTFPNIIKQAEKNPQNPIKICLVTRIFRHFIRLTTHLRKAWEEYNTKNPDKTFDLEVGGFCTTGGCILTPWIWKGNQTEPFDPENPSPQKRTTHQSDKIDTQSITTKRKPKESTEDHLYNEWELKFASGQTIYCGGSPGRDDSDTKKFKPELAEKQIRKKAVRYIISLDNHQGMEDVVSRLKENKIDIELRKKKQRGGSKKEHLDHNNRHIWKEIAELINSGESFIIHCMNGTHRGPFALTAGLIASGKVKSLGEAAKIAGLQIGNFTPYPGIIWQLITFARENNLGVEEEYINFYTQHKKPNDPELSIPTQPPTSPKPASPAKPAPAPEKPKPASPEKPTTTLQKSVEGIVEKMRADTVAVYVFDPETGKVLAQLSENLRLKAASLIKVPILFALHKAVEEGKVKSEDIPQLKKWAHYMISISDNLSTNKIIDYLGMEWVAKTIKELGFKDTVLERAMRDEGEDRENWITAKDMAKAMAFAISAKPPAGWPSAMDLMELNASNAKPGSLAKTLPRDVKIAQKGGAIAGNEHYAAIYTIGKKKFVMVVMVSDFRTREKAKEGIREIGRLVYDTLARAK
ncbi:serine hydrolase [Candidatus Peregrinibacteria bacterium]|nr:serine hydrolase [Candidatus Peregrinibacteria bacterium]